MNTLIKLALLLFTITLFACAEEAKNPTPAPTPDSTPAPITKISISDKATGVEGENITFTVTTNPPIAKAISFNYRVILDNPLTPTSVSISDLDLSNNNLNSNLTGTKTIASNNSIATISIATVNDNLRENGETFKIALSNLVTSSNATFDNTVGTGTILVNDTNGTVVVSVATAQNIEASGEIVFTARSNFPATSPLTFDYEATIDNPFNDNSSASTDDFDIIKRAATIPTGQDSTNIKIIVKKDSKLESTETFRLLLSNHSPNLIFNSTSAVGAIIRAENVRNVISTISDKQVTFNWTYPDGNFFEGVTIAYQLDRIPDSCSGGTAMVDKPKTSVTITGLTNRVSYYFLICTRHPNRIYSSGVPLNFIPRLADDDGNGLIDIYNVTEFNNIRYNLAANSYKTSMTDSGNTSGCQNNCRGYELRGNLDLSGDNWKPIAGDNIIGNIIFRDPILGRCS